MRRPIALTLDGRVDRLVARAEALVESLNDLAVEPDESVMQKCEELEDYLTDFKRAWLAEQTARAV